ncbi:MAG: cobalt-zinc-cadmium efflux system protein [Vicingaceae bacterium]|jgi:cobalt-zinc-cadmium efflux system protein
MILFALIGIAVNGYAAWKMIGGKSLNEKVISWHLLEDVLGWTAILIVAIVLQFYNNDYLDPSLSLLIAIFIIYNVFKRLKETLVIFMQSTPKEIDLLTLEEQILNLDNVVSTHHTNLWSLDGEKHVFTCHVKLKEIHSIKELLSIKKELKNVVHNYRFEHHTIEVELSEEECSMDSSSLI